jgi:hypothetical protein
MDSALQERIDVVGTYMLKVGQSVIPIGDNKTPAVPWTDYMEKPMEYWDYPGSNIGIVTGAVSGVVVVDCDTDAGVMGWIKEMLPTPLRVKTRRGMHFYYQHPGTYIKSDSHIKHANGWEYDVKGDKSYAMLPPSFAKGHQYQIVPCEGNDLGRWVKPDKLPTFRSEWRPERAKPVWDCDSPKIKDGLAYIKKIFALEGSGGDKETYRAACCLKDAGMDQAQALAALVEWNETNATPPWSIRDLLRKIQCAFEA